MIRSMLALTLGLLMATPAFASSCNSPFRALSVLAAAKADVARASHALQAPLLQRLDDLTLLVEAQARTLRDVKLDTLTPAARTALFATLRTDTDQRLALARNVLDMLQRNGYDQAAKRLGHYLAAYDICNPAHRAALLDAMALDGRLPTTPGLLPQLAKTDLVFACGTVLHPQIVAGETIGADGSPAFWQACAKAALAAMPTDNPDHFRVMHAVAEPLCAMATPEPPRTRYAQR